MSKDPAFLFYPSDFLTGTMFMTDEQVGKYIRLLSAQHQNGDRLTEDEMLFICKSHDSAIWSKFKKDEDGFYYNERLRIESLKRRNFCESRSKNKSGKTKDQDHMKNVSKSYDSHMEDRDINENHSILRVDPKIKPSWKLWVNWMQYEKDSANERLSYEKLIEISNGNPTVAISHINQSIRKKWRDFFPLGCTGLETNESKRLDI